MTNLGNPAKICGALYLLIIYFVNHMSLLCLATRRSVRLARLGLPLFLWKGDSSVEVLQFTIGHSHPGTGVRQQGLLELKTQGTHTRYTRDTTLD